VKNPLAEERKASQPIFLSFDEFELGDIQRVAQLCEFTEHEQSRLGADRELSCVRIAGPRLRGGTGSGVARGQKRIAIILGWGWIALLALRLRCQMRAPDAAREGAKVVDISESGRR
jgi:hypothetical protein